MKQFVFLFICLLFSVGLFAQSSYQAGIIPRINLSQKLENNWKINYKAESRIIASEGLISGSSSSNFYYGMTDLSSLVSKKIGLNNSFAFGYLIRLKDASTDHRFMQQFAMVERYQRFRLAHRFAADQTLKKNSDDIYRFRYRITAEIPLDGYSVDSDEFYIKLNHEYLNIFQKSEYDLEVRLVPLIGYLFKDSNKLEFGMDYRINNFIHRNTQNRYWLTLNWYISI